MTEIPPNEIGRFAVFRADFLDTEGNPITDITDAVWHSSDTGVLAEPIPENKAGLEAGFGIVASGSCEVWATLRGVDSEHETVVVVSDTTPGVPEVASGTLTFTRIG